MKQKYKVGDYVFVTLHMSSFELEDTWSVIKITKITFTDDTITSFNYKVVKTSSNKQFGDKTGDTSLFIELSMYYNDGLNMHINSDSEIDGWIFAHKL